MKQVLLLVTILCLLVESKAQTFTLDTIPGTVDTSSFQTKFVYDVTPDSTGLYYVEWSTNASFTGAQTSNINLITHSVDSFNYAFAGLTSNTVYWVRMAVQTLNLGLLYSQPMQVRTLTAYYPPTLTVDSTVRTNGNQFLVYYHCTTGNDTARVTTTVGFDPSFLTVLNNSPSQFRSVGQTSGVITVTVPNNDTCYVKVQITNRKGTRPLNPATWMILPFSYGNQQVTPVVDTAISNSFTTVTFDYSSNIADESWLITGDDSAEVAIGIGTQNSYVNGLGGSFYSNQVTVSNLTQSDRVYAAHVVRVGAATYTSAVMGISTLSTTPGLNNLVFVDADTNRIDLLWLINTNGYNCTILKKIGQPVLTSNTVVTSVSSGPLNPSLAIAFTGLQSGTQYQEQIGIVLYGDTIWSNTLTNQTVSVQQVTVGPLDMYMDPSVYQESDDSISVGVYYKSEGGPGTIWSETATDSNFLNVAFSSGASDVQSPGAGVYGYVSYTYFHFDDLVLDQTYYTRGVGFNASTGITHTDDYIAFGVYSTGINVMVDGEGNASYNNIRVKYVVPNKEIKLFLKIYSVEGLLVDQQSIDESQTTVVPKSGIYILTVCDKNGKIYGKRKCVF